MTIAHVQNCEGRARQISLEHEFELIERAKRDPNEFGVLYQRYSPMLLSYVHRRIGDVHATEDLVADIFVIVMRSLSSYQYRGIPLRSWLYRIATNAVNRWARRQRRIACMALEADYVVDTGGRSTYDETGDGYVQNALLALPPRFQAVLSLHHMEELSVKEIADIVGCREGTVRSRLARGRDALRKHLNQRR